MQKIITKIKKVLFRKKGASWCIVATERGIFKGQILWEAKESENIEFTGKWEVYKGERQFSHIMAKAVIPENPKEMLQYACEITKGFGEAMAGKIWDTCGEDWRNIERNSVTGLTETKFNALQETIELLECRKEETKAISFLMSKGCSLKLSQKAWEIFQGATIPKITANCYKLAELPRIGFKQIDSTIRYNFSIADCDDCRIRAGIQYALKELLNGGSSYVPLSILQNNALKLLSIGIPVIRENLRVLLGSKIIEGYSKHKAITLPEYKNYEEIIFNYAKNI